MGDGVGGFDSRLGHPRWLSAVGSASGCHRAVTGKVGYEVSNDPTDQVGRLGLQTSFGLVIKRATSGNQSVDGGRV